MPGGRKTRVSARQPASQSVSAQDAAALPASGEAAARVVDEVGVAADETVLIVGAAGSVGLIASQLAVARGATVLAAVRPRDFDLLAKAGATPVAYGPGLAANVRALVPSVNAVIDASGAGVLGAAVDLAGGPGRVVTLSDAAQVHRDLENGALRNKVLLSVRA